MRVIDGCVHMTLVAELIQCFAICNVRMVRLCCYSDLLWKTPPDAVGIQRRTAAYARNVSCYCTNVYAFLRFRL